MNMTQRWIRLWCALGLSGDAHTWFRRLVEHYRESHRHYHTFEHIEHGLTELDRIRHLAKAPDLLELAWWFHDAIYDPSRHDNEQRSAELSQTLLKSPRVYALIMATMHTGVPAQSDTRLLIDIDLSILGADVRTFGRYETNIRKEYGFVPDDQFREARLCILSRFLARDPIFHTQDLHNRLEARAKRNLTRSIKRLRRQA